VIRSLIFIVLSSLTLGHRIGQPVPTAAEILKKVADNYSKAQRLLIRGTYTFEGPGDGVESSRFLFVLGLPDRFRMEGVPRAFGFEGEFSERWAWVADGEATWTYEPGPNTYNRIVRSSPRGSVGTYVGGYPHLEEPEQFVASLRMSVPGWFPGVLDPHRLTTINRIESLFIKEWQVECFVVQSDTQGFSTKSEGTTRETLWIDKRRLVVWRRDGMMWVNNGLQEHLRVEVTTVELDGSLPKGMFKFRPPKGSKQVPIP